MSRCRPLIPSLVNTHRITDDQMIVLDAMDFEARRSGHGEVHEHHRRKEGKHHSRRGHGRRAFVAGYVPVIIAEIASNLSLDHGVYK